MLADLLGGRRKDNDETKGSPTVPGPELQGESQPYVAEPPLVSRLPASDPRFLALIQEFLRELGDQLDAMDHAWHARDFDELARLAHWLKGAGGTVGFDAFTKPSASLQQLAQARNEDQTPEAIAALRRLADRAVASSSSIEGTPKMAAER